MILEDNGYTVKVTEISDNAPMYTGLSKGDIDVLSSSWIERTHKSYWERFGKDLADLGRLLQRRRPTSSPCRPTPTSSRSTSCPRTPPSSETSIVGIEPGAGLTKTDQGQGHPGLRARRDFKLVLSSTAAMLTELKKATEAKKPIVVTLWKPFWANQAFPVRPLEDPKKAFGEPEKLHVVANKEYAEDHPEVANMLANFKLDDKQYGTLEDTVVNKFRKGQEEEAAKAWLEANPGYADALAAVLRADRPVRVRHRSRVPDPS